MTSLSPETMSMTREIFFISFMFFSLLHPKTSILFTLENLVFVFVRDKRDFRDMTNN
jgi:hypothetical protein